VDVLAGYAQWANNYPARAHNPLMKIEQQAMLDLLPQNLAGKRCLDLACGSGRYLRLMQARQAGPVFARHPSSPTLVRSQFVALPFTSETFDLITCGLAVGHERNLGQLLTEVARVLRVGGIIVYSDLHPFGAMVGWQRTFTAANGTSYSLEHYIHLYGDHMQACQSAGLTINAVLEPLAGELAPANYRHFPAVLVIRAAKVSCK
jgi:malonyl-CoA O-methyltransferase